MPTAGLAVRSGDLDADAKLAVATFVQYLNPLYDDARFDWVYRQNPHGRGRLWIATDADTENVVGIAGAFPRRMLVAGHEHLAWVLGDFCISEAYRSVGPALALQRACLAEVAAGTVPFCYDFPNAAMMAVYRRLGIKPLGQMVRLSRPLRIGARLSGWIGTSTLSRPLGALANLFLAPRQVPSASAADVRIALHEAVFGGEFTELCCRSTRPEIARVVRSAEYLNWRYRANPVQRHEVLTARDGGQLVGYAVFRWDAAAMTVVDLFANDEAEIVADLIRGAVALAWRRGVEAVNISLLECSSWMPSLTQAGFRPRETSPVVVYASRAAGLPEVRDERSWLLLCGDRDS